MAYHTIVFDLDGTLADTSPGIIETTRAIEQQLGLTPCDEIEIRSIIGPPLQQAFQRIYCKTEEEADYIVGVYRQYYEANSMALKTSLYPGMRELLEFLGARGVKMGVATHRVEPQARKTLESMNIRDFFGALHCYDEEGDPTKAQLIERVLDSLGVSDRSGVLMVGDSIYDSEGAAQAGVDFAAMTCGFGLCDPKVLAAFPNVVQASDAEQLARYIKANLA